MQASGTDILYTRELCLYIRRSKDKATDCRLICIIFLGGKRPPWGEARCRTPQTVIQPRDVAASRYKAITNEDLLCDTRSASSRSVHVYVPVFCRYLNIYLLTYRMSLLVCCLIWFPLHLRPRSSLRALHHAFGDASRAYLHLVAV